MWYSTNRWTTAKRCEYNGSMYDSGFEAGYAKELDIRLKAKEIKGWKKQVVIPLVVNGYLIANYRIDFVVEHNDGLIEYVETKGVAMPAWKLKWKIFEALYGDKPGVRLTVVKQCNNFNLRKLKKIKSL